VSYTKYLEKETGTWLGSTSGAATTGTEVQ